MEALIPGIGSIAVAHEGEGEADEDEDGATRLSSTAAGEGRSSLAGYAVQLVLSGIDARLKDLSAPSPPSDSAAPSPVSSGNHRQLQDLLRSLRPGLVVRAAQEAPDSAVRNAALSLVSVLATLMPEAVLGHVLQVRGVPGVLRCATPQPVLNVSTYMLTCGQ